MDVNQIIPTHGRWVIAIAAVIVFVFGSILFHNHYKEALLSSVTGYDQDNTSWNAYQLNRSLLRLQNLLEKTLRTPEAVAPEQIQLRIDIFINHAGIVSQGKSSGKLTSYPGNERTFRELSGFLARFRDYLGEDGASRLQPDVIRQMLDHIEELQMTVHELSLTGNQMTMERAQRTADEIRKEISHSTYLVLFLFALIVLLGYIVLRQIQQLNDKATDLSKALLDAGRHYAQLSSFMQAIDQHALVAVMDTTARIEYVNDRFCEIAGYSREELVGHNISTLRSGLHPDDFYEEVLQIVMRGEIWRGEICNLTRSGKLFWCDAANVPIRDENGRIDRFLSVRVDITEKKRSEAQISHLATHDVLTGLPNRKLLQDRIQQALAHDRRTHEHAAVLFIDLDNFKAINDTLGHDIGDLLLNEVASRLVWSVREEDTVARQGGDEFIVLLPNVEDAEDAGAVAQKLLAALTRGFHVAGRELFVSASIGIAVYPDDGNDVEALLKNSDIAMYHAKTNGRNNCQFFSSKLNEQLEAKQTFITDLRQALAQNEFRLVFQPIASLAHDDIAGIEVLLRWQHPEHGEVLPRDFIPLAEESGLIVPIGEWVMRSACQQIRDWLNAGYCVPRLVVNLSARQLRNKELANAIRHILQDTGVCGNQLGLEITESMLVENAEEAESTLSALSEMGVEISIDDFGTGYSSLSYLKRFPIHKLKIDRSFIKDVHCDTDDELIISAIIALAHGMQMTVVAEGVETDAQLAFLEAQGCDYYQGYYFSRPVPASEMEKRLSRITQAVGASTA